MTVTATFDLGSWKVIFTEVLLGMYNLERRLRYSHLLPFWNRSKLLPWLTDSIPLTRGLRLIHKHMFMHFPAWRPPEAVGKQGSRGETADDYRHDLYARCLCWKGASSGIKFPRRLAFKRSYSSRKIYDKIHKHQIDDAITQRFQIWLMNEQWICPSYWASQYLFPFTYICQYKKTNCSFRFKGKQLYIYIIYICMYIYIYVYICATYITSGSPML